VLGKVEAKPLKADIIARRSAIGGRAEVDLERREFAS
jgi:hypothetical protein